MTNKKFTRTEVIIIDFLQLFLMLLISLLYIGLALDVIGLMENMPLILSLAPRITFGVIGIIGFLNFIALGNDFCLIIKGKHYVNPR